MGFRRNMKMWPSLLVLMSGCTLGPDYKPPETNLPAAWSTQASPAHTAAATHSAPGATAGPRLACWWSSFGDPALSALIARAVAANPDVHMAESRVRQARASRAAAEAGLGPTASGSGGLRTSQSAGTAGRRPPSETRGEAGFDAGWELDLFGGTRRAIEAADADLRTREARWQEALVTLCAEVARDYVSLRGVQQRLAIARRSRASQEHDARLARQRFEGGFATALDAAQARAQAASTTAGIPVLEAAERTNIHGISVLLGLEPGALVKELSPEAPLPIATPAVPASVPSELLRRRPDIRAAEATLHAATARIGVAAADLFPKLSITGSVSAQATSLDSLADALNRFWSLGPSVRWDLYNAGRSRAQVTLQKLLAQEAAIAYRQVVLTALREVEDALVAASHEQTRHAALADAVEAHRRALDLAQQTYAAGQADFMNVLSSQRALYAAEDSLAQSTSAMATNLIALYKALGGGWAE